MPLLLKVKDWEWQEDDNVDDNDVVDVDVDEDDDDNHLVDAGVSLWEGTNGKQRTLHCRHCWPVAKFLSLLEISFVPNYPYMTTDDEGVMIPLNMIYEVFHE